LVKAQHELLSIIIDPSHGTWTHIQLATTYEAFQHPTQPR